MKYLKRYNDRVQKAVNQLLIGLNSREISGIVFSNPDTAAVDRIAMIAAADALMWALDGDESRKTHEVLDRIETACRMAKI